MQKDNINKTPGWDARQEFTYVTVSVAYKALMSSYRNPEDWLENMYDFHDWASAIIDNDYSKELKYIDKLLFSKKRLTQNEIKHNKEIAYNELRKLFRTIHKELMKKGIYIPQNEYKDEMVEFEESY